MRVKRSIQGCTCSEVQEHLAELASVLATAHFTQHLHHALFKGRQLGLHHGRREQEPMRKKAGVVVQEKVLFLQEPK
jgi:hypothetical protein